MPRNGSGTYSLPAGNPVTTGTTISSTWANSTLSDLATAMTGSIAKDGQTTATANLPMGTFRHTGVGNGVAATDYAALGQAQNDAFTLIGTISGADTITGVLTPTLTAYAAGQAFKFVSAGANTGAATINIDSLGAKAITKNGTTALVAGDIPSGALVWILYDGTQFQLQAPGNVTNATNATNATNLAGGVAGAIPYQSGVGATGFSAAGTTGQFALSGGTGAPTFISAASNAETLAGTDTAKPVTPAGLKSVLGLVKLNSGSVSAAATLDIVMTSYTAFTNKQLVVYLRPQNDGDDALLRTSSDGGSTFAAGASDYGYEVSVSGATTSVNAAYIALNSAAGVGSATTEGVNVVIDMFDTTNAAKWPQFKFEGSMIDSAGSPVVRAPHGAGARRNAEDTDAVRLLFSTGNIASGSWTLYGYN